MLTIKAKRSRTAEDTSPNWVLTNIQTQTALGSPGTQPIWRPSGEKVPGSMLRSWVRLQRLQFRVPPYNPRMLSVIISNLWANSTSVFLLMLFVCLKKPIMVLSLQLSRPRPLQGLDNLKICPLSYLWCHKPCTRIRQSGHSQSGQCSGRLEARCKACSALSLKPRQNYLISLILAHPWLTSVSIWIPPSSCWPHRSLTP